MFLLLSGKLKKKKKKLLPFLEWNASTALQISQPMCPCLFSFQLFQFACWIQQSCSFQKEALFKATQRTFHSLVAKSLPPFVWMWSVAHLTGRQNGSGVTVSRQSLPVFVSCLPEFFHDTSHSAEANSFTPNFTLLTIVPRRSKYKHVCRLSFFSFWIQWVNYLLCGWNAEWFTMCS